MMNGGNEEATKLPETITTWFTSTDTVSLQHHSTKKGWIRWQGKTGSFHKLDAKHIIQ